jgi:predicted TIM-barrel fold metal-dependent hydrolase
VAVARDDPGLPIKLGPCSNGEYLPPPVTPLVREAVRRARADVDANARRLGWTRRRFLLSACGSATVLAALAACSRESSDGRSGGTFTVPAESTTEPDAAREALGGDELVLDVQGHLLEYAPDSPTRPPDFPQASCGDDPRSCFDTAHFLDLVFGQSDTHLVVLSAVPFGEGLEPAVMDRAKRTADELCGEGRVLMQGEANPSRGSFDGALASMDELESTYDIRAWKVYTHAGGPGWCLDDHDGSAPAVGHRFLDHAAASSAPIVAVHKGLSGGSRFASPIDVGPAAAAHPDVAIVVYHSGFETDESEGPYADATRAVGVNRLLASLDDAGVGPGANVYAELGSTWRTLMGRPDEAAHVLGKLLKHLGDDNVVWGTDSIWYGSPQDQIEAFRAFEISEEYQERFGYPALTPERKAKILGLTSARLYGVDPVTTPCRFTPEQLDEARQASTLDNRTLGPRTAAGVTAVQRAHGW